MLLLACAPHVDDGDMSV